MWDTTFYVVPLSDNLSNGSGGSGGSENGSGGGSGGGGGGGCSAGTPIAALILGAAALLSKKSRDK
jgi:hypothetical protein